MPRYQPDPTKASFGFPLFQKGMYRLELGEPKSFAAKDGSNYGVRVNGKVITSNDHPELVGKQFPISLYMHTEGAENYSKGVYAKALGCKTDAEFNEKYGGEDWSFNTDDASVGSGWHLLKGTVIDVVCGEPAVSEKSKTGDLQTVVENYMVAE